MTSMNAPGAAHVAYTLAAITVLGGAMGYAKKASTRSLLAGLVFGGCYAASAYFITQGDAQRGFRFALGNSAALAVAMGYRFVKSKKFMPAGMMAVMGTAGAVYYGMKYSEYME